MEEKSPYFCAHKNARKNTNKKTLSPILCVASNQTKTFYGTLKISIAQPVRKKPICQIRPPDYNTPGLNL
jgi:hypothetical protein